MFDIAGAKIAVIGLDPDGFSLARLAASRGFATIGYDPDEVKVAQLEAYAAERTGPNLSITSEKSLLRDADVFVLCVAVDRDSGASNLGRLETAARAIGEQLQENSLVIIESEVYPGVCEHLILPVLERASELDRPAPERSRHAFLFAHAPPAHNRTKRIIGALSPDSFSRAGALYRALGIDCVAVRSVKEAEAVSMVEDSLHDVSLALSGEFSILFDRIGIDIASVSKALRESASGQGIFSGVGLPRTSSEAYYLSRSGHEHRIDQQFLITARRIIDYMPTYAVTVLAEALHEIHLELKGTPIALLGISDDSGTGEDGIGAKIMIALGKKGADTRAYDPDVAGAGFDLKETLESAQAVIIASTHPMFRSLTPRQFEELGVRVVVDARTILDKDAFEKSSVLYRGIGRG